MKTYVYVGVAVMGGVNKVLDGLMARIRRSGLYDFCDGVYLVVSGDVSALSVDLSGDKIAVLNPEKDVSKCEFPALRSIFEHSLEDEFRVLYMHTKGVSRTSQNIEDWTALLAYFNADRWQDRLAELDSSDCTGINLFGNREHVYVPPNHWGYGYTPVHYGGNFWWSHSRHIRRLVDPVGWAPDSDLKRGRMMAEMWICSISTGSYYCAFSSGVDHYQAPYPASLYEA